MALPSISDLKLWVGTLFTKDDWDFNFTKIVSWFSDGNADLVVNTVKATNGIDMDGAQITNIGAATTGSAAVNLDQAQTLLNRTSYYYPYSVASGKVNSSGESDFLQKNSDTQVTVLAGNTNPDLVIIQSDATVESVTSNTVLTVGTSNGTYNIVKEKGESIVITTGSVSVGTTYPDSPDAGDYFLNNSIVPFVGYKYDASAGWQEIPFCHLGYVTVSSGVATVKPFEYNFNNYNIKDILSDRLKVINWLMPDFTAGVGRNANTTYTATTPGWICVLYNNNNASRYSVYINGVRLQGANGSNNVSAWDSIFLPVGAGDTYSCQGGFTFYPCKGGI